MLLLKIHFSAKKPHLTVALWPVSGTKKAGTPDSQAGLPIVSQGYLVTLSQRRENRET